MASIEKRINKDKSISYRVKVCIKGYPEETATFDKITDARIWATNTESSIREQRYFKSKNNRHTLGDLIDRYIDTILVRKPKSIAHQKQQLLWWKERIGLYNLNDVNAAMISETRDKLVKVSASTINRYMAALNHAFNIAIKEWEWLEVSPMRNIKKLKEPRGRTRYLSDAERVRLLEACKESSYPDLYTIVVVAISTGARKMELLSLKWKDVYFDRNAIILHETKNGEIKRLPLVGKAYELLKNLESSERNIDSYVFVKRNPTKPVNIEYEWRKALKKANIENFKYHDLRHTAASYLTMNSASPIEVAEMLGHKSLQMVSRYSHLSDSHTTNVARSMNKKIFGE